MTNLINGADALRALADGKTVEVKRIHDNEWQPAQVFGVSVFTDSETTSFRLKPKTITLNGIEVPCCGENYQHGDVIYILNSLKSEGYSMVVMDEPPSYWWREEDEIKQVVSALRTVFKTK